MSHTREIEGSQEKNERKLVHERDFECLNHKVFANMRHRNFLVQTRNTFSCTKERDNFY